MISKKFLDRVEYLKHTTKTSMDDIQKCCCPMVKHVYLNYQFEYWYDGYKYNIWEDNVQLYAVKEIPYCYDNYKNNVSFQGKLTDLVNEDKVWPFLLFVNNHVVPWSKITIIRDYDYSYLRIDGESDDFSDNAIMVYFPIASKKIIYGEDEDYSRDPEIHGLYFDKDGYLLESPEFEELSLRIEFKADLYFKMIRSNMINKDNPDNLLIKFDNLAKGKVPTLENILLFDKDGKIIGSANDNKTLVSDQNNGAYGYFNISNAYSISEGLVVMMYFEKHADSSSYIYTKTDLMYDRVVNAIKFPETEPLALVNDVLFQPFDFKFDRDLTYDQNIHNATQYITKYDFSLWNDVLIKESPIKSYTYTGKEFKRLADLRSYVKFSRKHSDLIEDVAMMFVNSRLYQNSIDISYTNNTINIPAFGILDSDVVEIVIFTKCNNNILNIKVESKYVPVYIHPEYNLTDCYIMDTQSSISEYPETPDSPENRKQYICELTYTRDADNNYYITFKDPSHYGRNLKIVPKNQFRYYRYSQVSGQHKIILPMQFNYCHDADRYSVFVNGRKIDHTEYTITIMNDYRPFDQLVLYLSTILVDDDRVDVFYLPEYLVEKYKESTTTLNGTIRLRTDYPKLYALSKNTCMVFVNGFKINPLDIKDISMNTMLVNTKYNTINNVTIVEYMDGAVEIAKYLYGLNGSNPIAGDTTYDQWYQTLENLCGIILSNGEQVNLGVEDLDFTKVAYDQWTLLINVLAEYYANGNEETDDDIDSAISNIYQMYPTLDPALLRPDYKDDYAPLKAILYDIIVDFYVQRNGVDTGKPFTYDFEMDQWGKDGKDNADITLYPDHDKLLDYNLDTDEAIEPDVLDGKQFESI